MGKEENTIFCLQGMNGNIEEMIRFMIILYNSIKNVFGPSSIPSMQMDLQCWRFK